MLLRNSGKKSFLVKAFDFSSKITALEGAQAPAGGFDAIISGQIAAVNEGPLHAGSVNGGALFLQALPYTLLEDI